MHGKFEKPHRRRKGPPAVLLILLALLAAAGWIGFRIQLQRTAGPDTAVETVPAIQPEATAETPEEPEAAAEMPAADRTVVSMKAASETATAETPQTVTLMALGDNLIHNCVYWSAETEDGYDFSPFYADIREQILQHDIACINQETILVCEESAVSNYPAFGTPAAMADALADAGFQVVTHASNHAYDKGLTGLDDTLSVWKERHPDVTVLGIHDTQEDAETLCIVEENGIRIAMLNYTYGLNAGQPAEAWRIDCFSDWDAIADKLRTAAEIADFTIVFAHWGEDGNRSVTATQRKWAAFLAEHGADLIIGTHPHVLQPLEMLETEDGREVPVFWSLGNFLSHQDRADEMLGGMADVELTKEDGTVAMTRCSLIISRRTLVTLVVS